MPLSLALQARLLERGILSSSSVESDNINEHSDIQEEVIAESYDERDEHISKHDDDFDSGIELEECINCPNKTNPYHECSDYCKKRYGIKRYAPDAETERRRRKMLKKYPLPENWREIPDVATDRAYYWNIDTDDVSWLPPEHPRSYVTQSAIRLKRKEYESKSVVDKRQTQKKKVTVEEVFNDDDSDEDEVKSKRKSSGKLNQNYVIDPMDPASYSDIPRGKWSTGLNIKGKAPTGVDETASGELFQARPYKSPGDIMRMNAGAGDSDEEDTRPKKSTKKKKISHT